MPSLSTAKAANEKLSLANTVAVIVGGTGGIGAALAFKIAQYSKKPEVHIVGRNVTAGQDIIAQMKDVNPDGKYEFHKCDISLLSQVRPVIKELGSRLPRITHLVVSPCILNTAGRIETPEGNDIKMMLFYYCRFLFIRDLTPSLIAGNAKIMNVLNALLGNKKKLDWEDLDLRKKGSYSLTTAVNHTIVMTDIAMQHLAAQNPTITYTHAFPGYVSTNVFNDLVPSYLSGPTRLLYNIFGVSSSKCAEWLFYAMQNNEAGTPHYVDNHGDPIKGKVLANDEEIEKVWKHTSGIVDA